VWDLYVCVCFFLFFRWVCLCFLCEWLCVCVCLCLWVCCVVCVVFFSIWRAELCLFCLCVFL